MSINLHILNASGKFDGEKENIQYRFGNAVRSIKNLMPIEHIDIVIMCSKCVITEIGIGGYSPDAHTLNVYLDPDHDKYHFAIAQHLDRILAHESHHCMRWRGPGYGKTLGEALVTEGLADHFDRELNGKPAQPWSKALSGEQIEILKSRSMGCLWEPYDHRAWFFGSEKEDLPRWGGYSLGYYLIHKYLEKKPGERASILYAKPAEEIFRVLQA